MSISTHYTMISNELILVWEETCKEHEYKVGHEHPGTHPQLLVPLVLCDGLQIPDLLLSDGLGLPDPPPEKPHSLPEPLPPLPPLAVPPVPVLLPPLLSAGKPPSQLEVK